MFSHSVTVTLRAVKAPYTFPLGVIDINCFHTGPHPTDTPQRRYTIDKGTVYLHLATHHKTVAALSSTNEALIVVIWFNADIEASLAQALGQHRMRVVGYEYLDHLSVEFKRSECTEAEDAYTVLNIAMYLHRFGEEAQELVVVIRTDSSGVKIKVARE